MKFMNTGWFKSIITLVTLLFCMSVLYVPALATELDSDTEHEMEQDTQGEFDGIPDITNIFEIGELLSGWFSDPGNTPENAEYDETGATGGSGYLPLTPSGTGTVVDNATDSEGKEFYTIKTEDGDIFYLVIDRQRNTENVYFLNTVTVSDLMALAEKNGTPINTGVPVSASSTEQTGTGEMDEPTTPTPVPAAKESGNNTTMYIVVGVVFLAVGGAAYYFKIVKGKKNSGDEDEYEDEYGYTDEQENGGDNVEDGNEADE